jgi:O-antigen/teichoic acid export membrane protein
MLGLFGTPADVGMFGVAARLALPLSFLGASIQAVYEPKFAGLYRTGNYVDLHSEFRTSLRHSFLLAVGMLVSMALLAEPLLLLFGKEFLGAKPSFLVMLVGTCSMAALGPSGSLMTMTHKGHYNAWVAIASLPLAAGLLYALVPNYGGFGAALAISGVLIFRTFAQAWAAELHLKELKLKA